MPAEDLLRKLPSIDRLLSDQSWAGAEVPSERRRSACRTLVQELREAILSGGTEVVPEVGELALAARRHAENGLRVQLRPVINATGVLLHTNLGRAPLSEAALSAIARCAGRYTNVEYDLDSGRRDSRHRRLSDAFAAVLGAEDVVVVNNNAAAVFLALAALAGKGVPVAISRGEQVEIGGSFRMPEIMESSGARLMEVGTTNRTRKADYESAIQQGAGLLLKVHRSNFEVLGFTEECGIEDLIALGREYKVPVVYDLGSGRLEPDPQDHSAVRAALSAGVDLVLFSGDKLLGGPQAGIVAGKTSLIAKLGAHPLMRMLRPGKLTLLALEATLLAWARNPGGEEIPVARMAMAKAEDLEVRANSLATRIREAQASELEVSVEEVQARPGGGAGATASFPSWAVVLCPCGSEDALASALRRNNPPVVGRIEKGKVLLDLRTLLPGDDQVLADAVISALVRSQAADAE